MTDTAKPDFAATTANPAQTEAVSGELVERLTRLRKFLDGSGSLEGRWFGEVIEIAGRKVPFWWRKQGLKAIDEAADRIEALEKEVERLTIDGVHTCHDQCPRISCTLRREKAVLEKQLREAREALADPSVVHLNMLRGGIAKPSVACIWHLYGEMALIDGMPQSARAFLNGEQP